MAWRDYGGRRDRARNFPGQFDLVPAVEPEFVLRKGLRRNCFRSAGAALNSWTGRAIRHHQPQRKINDESPAHHQRKISICWKKDLGQLRQYPLDRQTASQKLSTRVLDWFLAVQAEGEKWQWHNYPVNQLFGVQNQFPVIHGEYAPALSQKDCEYYVMRLNALPKKFDQLLEGLKIREEKQILPPRFVVEEVLKEMSDFIAKPLAENILATSFNTRAAKIDKLTETERADFQKRV